MNMWIKMDERARRPLFLGLVIILVFIYYPIKKGSQKVNYMPWYDIVMAAVGAFCFFFYPLNLEKIVSAGTRIQKAFVVQIGSISIPLLIVFAIIGTLILVECCRRVVGMPIICVATVFVLYAFFGAGKDLKTVMYNLFYTTTGILGTPIGVCSTYIALFVIFGAFLEATGVANFFIDCANALVGWASGGPAKVAVVSSALCGMVSGSSVGNTVTTGSVTIPMMKKTGYPPEFAGAVEAASSTGGQIMPPIMGAAAFLMAEMVGVPYAKIIVRAILPAFLYFLGIFLGVHFKAKKLGLKGLPREELPKWKLLLPQIYLILPLVVLVYMIMIGFTMATAAVYATLYCVVVAMISREEGKKKLVMAIPLIPLLFMTLMSRSFQPGTFMGENGSTLCLAIAFALLVINYAISKPNVKSLPTIIDAFENGGKNCLSVGIAWGEAGLARPRHRRRRHHDRSRPGAHRRDRRSVQRSPDHRSRADDALLHRARHGRSHHRELHHHGHHLRADPCLRHGSQPDGCPHVLLLLRYRRRHHPARCAGCLRRFRHRQGSSDEDRLERDPSRNRGVHHPLHLCLQ